MLNFEKNIDLIVSSMTGNNCKFVREHILKVDYCTNLFTCEECKERVKQWLLEEYKEPEIDWFKVPAGTPVLVRDSDGNKWRESHFALYLPNGYRKFCVIANGKNHENAVDVAFWGQCKLAEEIDPTPYLVNN